MAMDLSNRGWGGSTALGVALAFAFGCGDGSTNGGDDAADRPTDHAVDADDASPPDEAGEDVDDGAADRPPDVEEDVPGDVPAEVEPDAEPDATDAPEEEADVPPPYVHGSLAACLLDPGCDRVLITSHMGAWNTSIPGNSMAAYRRAYDLGADAIEGDIRVSRDGVPFMIHDDAITYYESLLCAGRVVSESDASDIDGCLLLPSLTETIPTFAEFVEWARGKLLIHLDVKNDADVAVMIEQIIAHDARDFVYIAIGTGEAAGTVPAMPDSDRVYFLLRVGSAAEVDAGLGALRRPNLFLFEGDRAWPDTGVDETAMLAEVARVHAAGLRIMASSDQYLATVEDHQHLFDMGFDMILSYNCENGVAAARAENESRGLPP